MSVTLRHLNDDTSWLLTYGQFHILIDPWFSGPQTDYFRYFSTQEHASPSSIQDINRDLGVSIDAVIISHEFTDHCHEQTLLSLSPATPVFATTNAAKLIRRWNHFDHVFDIPILDGRPDQFTLRALTNGRTPSSMPETISVGYIPEKKFLALPSLHGATCISLLADTLSHWHSLLYIPHGCEPTSIRQWLTKQSNVTICALMQGFDRVANPIWLGGELNYGCSHAAQLAVSVKAKHWISTHDENKIGRGLVSLFLKRDHSSIDHARKELDKLRKQSAIPLVHQVPNGESLVLELLE